MNRIESSNVVFNLNETAGMVVMDARRFDDVYHPEDEAVVIWDDPDLRIEWPLPADEILLSAKDAIQSTLREPFGRAVSMDGDNR